jgi:hypothetical protein
VRLKWRVMSWEVESIFNTIIARAIKHYTNPL